MSESGKHDKPESGLARAVQNTLRSLFQGAMGTASSEPAQKGDRRLSSSRATRPPPAGARPDQRVTQGAEERATEKRRPDKMGEDSRRLPPGQTGRPEARPSRDVRRPDPRPSERKPDKPPAQPKRPEERNTEALREEMRRVEARKLEARRAEGKRQEQRKPEPAKTDPRAPTRPESKRPEARNLEARKLDPRKTETTKAEAKKADPKKPDLKKPDARKIEQKKRDSRKLEARRLEALRAEARKAEKKLDARDSRRPDARKALKAPAPATDRDEDLSVQDEDEQQTSSADAMDALESRLEARTQIASARTGISLERMLGRKLPDIRIPALFQRVKDQDIMIFTRQFATMINAGLPMLQCLTIQCFQAPNLYFREQLKDVRERIKSGATLAGALKRFPDTFDALYVNLVAAGELGGALDVVLVRLANYIEKAAKLKRQIKAAMVYPSAIVVVAFVVVVLLMVKVVPVFQRMFEGVGAEIPTPTQVVIDVSMLFRGYFWLIGLTIAGLVGGGVSLYRSLIGRFFIDRMLLRLPVFGELIVKIEVARFSRTLATLLSSGVSIIDALEVCARAAGNVHVMAGIRLARKGVSEGKLLGRQLVSNGVFPPLVCQMITVGEASGALDMMLTKLADFYELEVETAVDAMVSLIEPAFMLFLGIMTGALLIALYMPIFVMSSALGHF